MDIQVEGSFQGCIRIQGDGLSFEILNLPVEFPTEIDFIEYAWDARSIREWICHITDLLSYNGIEGRMSVFSRSRDLAVGWSRLSCCQSYIGCI